MVEKYNDVLAMVNAESALEEIVSHAKLIPSGWDHDGNGPRNAVEATCDILDFISGRLETLSRDIQREYEYKRISKDEA